MGGRTECRINIVFCERYSEFVLGFDIGDSDTSLRAEHCENCQKLSVLKSRLSSTVRGLTLWYILYKIQQLGIAKRIHLEHKLIAPTAKVEYIVAVLRVEDLFRVRSRLISLTIAKAFGDVLILMFDNLVVVR